MTDTELLDRIERRYWLSRTQQHGGEGDSMNTPLFPLWEAVVRKLALHDVYILGKQLRPLASIEQGQKVMDKVGELYQARQALDSMLSPASPLLEASRRAASKLRNSLRSIIPDSFEEFRDMPKDLEIDWLQAYNVTSELAELESVLGNDMPSICAYLVDRKGIFDTQALIDQAENHFVESVRSSLSAETVTEFREAGKCLAYERSTACAFHLWRAVELVACRYYEALTGGSFEKDGVARNWGAYIAALQKRGGDKKITGFLDHIRAEYRNPHMHPNEVVDLDGAQALFNVATSAVSQMVLAIKALPAPPSAATPATVASAAASAGP